MTADGKPVPLKQIEPDEAGVTVEFAAPVKRVRLALRDLREMQAACDLKALEASPELYAVVPEHHEE